MRRVTGLSLDGEGQPLGTKLKGELPLELAFLQDLEVLNLSHNLLSGKLVGETFHWKNMKVVQLNDNQLVSLRV